MEKITRKELEENDGQGGKPSYVAVDGIVYDVSGSKRWVIGGHMGLHSAGSDLTRMIKLAPHGHEMLSRFPVVGELKE